MNKHEALDFLSRIAEGIAITFGGSCETLIHDMSKKGHPILAIYNGHVSGRSVGSTINILGSEANIQEYLANLDLVNHLALTPSGKRVKSSTFHMIGDDYRYALGINFDITSISESNRVLLELMNVKEDLRSAINHAGEGVLSDLFSKCMGILGVPVKNMKKKDRVELISLLNQNKAFEFQKSVPFVADMLGVSRYTIYKYLHELEGNGSQD